jgi:hypothetical protein
MRIRLPPISRTPSSGNFDFSIFESTQRCGPFVGTFHATSRKPTSLTAPVAHTTVSKSLISFECHPYPSWAQYKIDAQKTVFSRSSTLHSSVHCTHSAYETGHCTRPLQLLPSSLLNWKSRELAGTRIHFMLGFSQRMTCRKVGAVMVALCAAAGEGLRRVPGVASLGPCQMQAARQAASHRHSVTRTPQAPGRP